MDNEIEAKLNRYLRPLTNDKEKITDKITEIQLQNDFEKLNGQVRMLNHMLLPVKKGYK